MTPKTWILIAATMGGLAVALGAFGAHGLRGQLERQSIEKEELEKRLANWETAARYQMYHALALLALFAAERKSLLPLTSLAGWSWLAGVCIFSGCLYVLVLSGVKVLGAVVPIGGVLLIVGWVLVAVAVWRE